ncbi:MAG: SCO family protein [Gammaproteobacteria bacterium]|nr:SCO family protein [Gammaproteobacteria bacterium]
MSDLNKNTIFGYTLLIISIVLIFVLPYFISQISNHDYYGLKVDKPAPKFDLSNTQGNTYSTDDLSGSYSYLMFGFTHCQTVCPLQVSNFLAIKDRVNDKPVRFVFITLDPKRDTLATLKQYFEKNGDNFIALRTKSFQESQELARKYHEYAYVNEKGKINYQINHNGYIFLINPDGILELIYTSIQLNHDEMINDLTKLMSIS